MISSQKSRRFSAAQLLMSGMFLAAISCSQTSQQNLDTIRQGEIANFVVLSYYNSGNCLHNYRQGSELGKMTCSRAPLTLCRQDALYDTAGTLTVTSETSNRFKTEIGQITKDLPHCTVSSAAALNLPGYKTTSVSFNSSVSTKNTLTAINDCGDLGNTNLSKLADRQQYNFLISARGVLAYSARQLNQTSCFNDITYSQWEKDTAGNFVSGSLILETSCLYGSSAFVTVCNSTEKQYASRFDFVNPL